MRSFFISTLLFVISLLLYSSCYEPNGANYVEVPQPIPPDSISIDFSESGDTIYWIAEKSLYFTYYADGAQIRWARCVFDDLGYMDCSDSSYNSFTFNSPFNLEPGIHTMDVYIFTKTYTGSLADIKNAEGFLAHRRWVLVFLEEKESTPVIKSKKYESNGLRLFWETKDTLPSVFYLSKSLDMSNWTTIDTVYANGSSSAIDENYVGERCSYRVERKVLSGPSFVSEMYNLESVIPTPQFSWSDTDFSISISWNRTPFDVGFGCYRLQISGREPIIITDINQINSSSKFNSDFETIYFSFTIVPKDKPNDFKDVKKNYSVGGIFNSGLPLPETLSIDKGTPYSPKCIGASLGKMYYIMRVDEDTKNNLIVEYDVEQNEIASSVNVLQESAVCSLNGNYILCYSNREHNFCLYDWTRKSELNRHSYYEVGNSSNQIKSIAVSDNGIVAMAFPSSIVVYDAVAGKTIGSLNVSSNSVSISPNAEYLVVQTESTYLYRIGTDKINKLKWFNGSYELKYIDKVGFISNYELALATNSTMTLANLQEGTMQSKQQFNYSNLLLFDLNNAKFCTEESSGGVSFFNIFDIRTRDRVGTVSSSLSSYYNLSYPYMINSTKARVRIHPL